MSFVSSHKLPKLRCTRCRKYLSYFPIYQSLHLNGPLCGRCPIEGTVQENPAYEQLAISQKFPCCYDMNGCLEHLYPDQVPLHEQFCTFRKYNCPSSLSTKCKWEGFAKDMWDHYKKQHLVFTLRNQGFEIDFIGTYNESSLLNVEDEVYIVNKTNTKDKFSFNVSYIGSNSNSGNYSYKLTLQNASKKELKYVITQSLTIQTVLNKNFIMETLENPVVVVAIIEICKSNNKDEEQLDEVQWDLLTELECSYCFEYMLPPIQQCITGHSICSNCKPKQSECPTCKKDFKDTVNITLGKLIDHLTYPCRNEGCTFTCKASDIKKHESNCTYGKFKCPLHDYEDCTEEISYLGLYDHVLNNHYENLLETERISIPFKGYNEENVADVDDENDIQDCFILRYDFRLFLLHYKYEFGMFSWAMQLIGTPEKNVNYGFEIDVIGHDDARRVCFRRACTYLTDKENAFEEEGGFICIDYDQIDFIINDEVPFNVRILTKQ